MTITGRRIGRSVALALGGMLALLTGLGLIGLQPFTLNRTSSLPKGLYVRSFETPHKGAIVWFPLPERLQAYVARFPAASRWFAQPGNGLLKPVVGLAGDTICRGADGVFSVNGRPLGRAPADGPEGRPLPSWQGCQRLEDGELAVFSDHLPDSLDSRFYGAIAAPPALVYRPLWTDAP